MKRALVVIDQTVSDGVIQALESLDFIVETTKDHRVAQSLIEQSVFDNEPYGAVVLGQLQCKKTVVENLKGYGYDGPIYTKNGTTQNQDLNKTQKKILKKLPDYSLYG